MARLSVLEKSQLSPEIAKQVELAGAEQAILFRVLGHSPEMFQAYFRFYFPWHTGGSVEPVLKELVRLKIAQINDCFT